MILDINEQYYLTSDSYNFVIMEKRIAKSGKTKGKRADVAIGFLPELSQACRRIITLNLMRSDIEGFGALEEHIRSLYDDIEKAVDKHQAQEEREYTKNYPDRVHADN